jgi:predicted SPOUT superfamily RNA methylase MTH1
MTTSILVPSSLVREAEDKREATRKLGTVARAAAVFRADRLVVFPDTDGERRWGEGFVTTVLRYAATPPHLRKEAFGTRDELEYAGVLPPLRLPTQTGSGSSGSGSLRQGIVTAVEPEERVRVTCGMQHPLSLPLPDDRELREGDRVTIRIASAEPLRARLVDEPIPGFSVETAALDSALERADAGVTIATSRHGESLTVSRLGTLVERIETDGMTVAFGAPQRGLPAILDRPTDAIAEESASDRFDLWLNAIPQQGSDVVRTEEALFAVLASLTLTE